MRQIVLTAIEELCAAFSKHGYNPTPIIDLGVLIASADGKVEPAERELLLDVFQTLLDTTLTPEVVDHLISASLEVIEAAGAGGAEARARLVGAILQDCDSAESGLTVAIGVAFASEGLSLPERAVIERIAQAADVGHERLEALISRVRDAGAGDPVSVRELLGTGSRR